MRSLKKLLQKKENRDVYDAEGFKLDFAIEINALLAKRGLTRAEFADRLATSRANVTQILSGDRNLTATSLGRILRVLDAKLEIRPVEDVQKKAIQTWSVHDSRQDTPAKIIKYEPSSSPTGWATRIG